MRVTLLTDFGTADGYVAAIKGVLAQRAPGVVVDDASHDVPPGDITAAAWALATYAHLYPEDTVHLVVVDPGVGTARRALAARIAARFYVAPDNGVLTRVLATDLAAEIVEIRNPDAMLPSVSRTFHGRDVFAPAAAWLARGDALDRLGPSIQDPVLLELPSPGLRDGRVTGEVVHVDRFGNLITNIGESWLVETARIVVEGRDVGPPRRSYGEVPHGEPLALIGSAGTVEIAVRDGNAAEVLAVGRGALVLVEPAERISP